MFSMTTSEHIGQPYILHIYYILLHIIYIYIYIYIYIWSTIPHLRNTAALGPTWSNGATAGHRSRWETQMISTNLVMKTIGKP